jgi:hypothetical protein
MPLDDLHVEFRSTHCKPKPKHEVKQFFSE